MDSNPLVDVYVLKIFSHSLINLLSYPTLDHQPWVELPPVEWGHPHQSLIKNMPRMLAHRPVWWGHFSVSSQRGSLFQDDQSLSAHACYLEIQRSKNVRWNGGIKDVISEEQDNIIILHIVSLTDFTIWTHGLNSWRQGHLLCSQAWFWTDLLISFSQRLELQMCACQSYLMLRNGPRSVDMLWK